MRREAGATQFASFGMGQLAEIPRAEIFSTVVFFLDIGRDHYEIIQLLFEIER